MKSTPTISDLTKAPFVIESKDGKIMRVIFPSSVRIGVGDQEALTTFRTGIAISARQPASTGPVNVSAADTIICVAPDSRYNASTVRFDINLPPTPVLGQLHIIKDTGGDAGTKIPRIVPALNHTIDNSSSYELNADYMSSGLMWTGSGWSVVFTANASGSSGGGAPTTAAYVMIGNDPAFSAERSLTAGTGITVSDAGANSTVTLGINDNIVATVSGTRFSGITNHVSGLSGSLTRLVTGESYLVAGSNMTVQSQSNGQVILSSTGGGPGGTLTVITASHTSSISANNTMLYWRFDSGDLISGQIYLNTGASSSLKNSLTASSTSAIVTNERGVFGKAVGFTATGYAVAQEPQANVAGQRLTVSAWIRPYVQAGGWRAVTAKQYTSGSHTSPFWAVSMYLLNTNNYFVEYALVTGAGSRTTMISAEKLRSESWNHIALVYDGALMIGYINGSETVRTAKTGDVDWGSSPGCWHIGGNSAASEQFSGSIDDVKIESIARTQEEIRREYELGVFKLYVLDNIQLVNTATLA